MKSALDTNGFMKTAAGSTFIRRLSLLLLGLSLAACSQDKPATGTASGKIVIRGSNTVGEELAPKLIAAYKKTHAQAAFDLESKATGYGLASLMAGQCDIAAASREAIKHELEEARSRKIELKDQVIGYYSVAVVANSGNALGDLTKDQVRDIFTGAVQNWKEVGGPDAPIHLYVRDPISGTYLGFKELAMENKPYAAEPNLFTNYAAIVDAVAKDPNGIGYAGIEAAGKPGIKLVSIGGIAPTAATVCGGKYPYTRAVRFYTNKAKTDPSVADFIQFVLSPKGKEVLVDTSFVPAP